MAETIQGGQKVASGLRPTASEPDPKTLANQILIDTGGRSADYDRLGQIEARLDIIQRKDAKLAGEVRHEIMTSPMLNTVEKGTLSRNAPGFTIDIGKGLTIRSIEDGIDLDRWINMQRRGDTPVYAQLVTAAGSHNNNEIKEAYQEAIARGIGFDQLGTARLNEAARKNPEIVAYLDLHMPAILKFSHTYGVSASSVAGVIGEEMRNVRMGETWLEENALNTTREAANQAGGSFTKTVEDQYEMYKGSIEAGMPIKMLISGDKGRHVAKAAGVIVAQDIGAGNINFGEGIRLLKIYNASNPDADPLEIKKYNGDYEALFNDLRSQKSDASIKFAVMKVKDVVDSFNANPRIQPIFAKLDTRGRDAAIDAGYRTSAQALTRRAISEGIIYKPREGTYDYFYNPESPYNVHPFNAQ